MAMYQQLRGTSAPAAPARPAVAPRPGTRSARRETAAALLEGRPATHVSPATPGYAVVALRAPGTPASALEEAVDRHASGSVAPALLADGRGHVLIPARDQAHAVHLGRGLQRHLTAPAWLAVVWCPRDKVPAGRATADDILEVVLALQRTAGLYQLDDAAVEYAAAHTPAVAGRLVRLIRPVLALPALRSTLEALIAADGNRSRAAEQLVIHRSTIDYRLQRIEQLTGLSPTSLRGLQTLSTALAVHALAVRRLPVGVRPGSPQSGSWPGGTRTSGS